MYCIIVTGLVLGSLFHDLEHYWWYLPVILGLFLLGWLLQWLLVRKAPRRRKWLLVPLGAMALLVDIALLLGLVFGWSGPLLWVLLYQLHWIPLAVVFMAWGAGLCHGVLALGEPVKKET